MSHPARKTIATSTTSPAPLQIILYTLPVWGASMALTLFMPMTGVITSTIMIICILVLPFKARRGCCPACNRSKTFPFSGFGNACKGCGEELVLRKNEIHLLEPKQKNSRPGTGRTYT
ncbi:MAG: hypothetical protein ABUK11_06330 [Mariprofundaceae bacterium]